MRVFKKKAQKIVNAIDSWCVGLAANYRKNVIYKDIKVPNELARKKILCNFAHFSADLKIDESVVFLVQALSEAGCDIIFVSSSGEGFDLKEFDKLNGFVIGKILRQNFGYDFGSWKSAVDAYPSMSSEYDEVIFVNDSVYGPFSDLGKILQDVSNSEFDVWALTDSFERQYHLQSYMWGVRKEGLNGKFFEYFWHKYFRYCSSREEAIKQGELSISKVAEQKFNLKVGACFRILDLANRYLSHEMVKVEKCNPVQHLAYALLRDEHFPLVKRELLLKNPLGVKELASIKEHCQAENPELWMWVKKSLNL